MMSDPCDDYGLHCAAPVLAVGPDFRVIEWNEACAQLWGIPVEEALGQPCWEVVAGLDLFGNPYCGPTCPLMQMRQAIRDPRPFELWVTTPLGRRLYVFVPFRLGCREGGEGRHYYVIVDTRRRWDAQDVGPPAAAPPMSPDTAPRAAGRPTHPPKRLDVVTAPPPCSPSERPCSSPAPRLHRPRTAASTRRAVTARESDVLRLLATGAGTTEIAAQLGISSATVRNHVQRVLDKLGAHSRLEAVAIAMEEQLL